LPGQGTSATGTSLVDAKRQLDDLALVTVTSKWLKKQADEQRRIRRNQPRVSSEEARKQFARVQQGSVSIGQSGKR
jgi:hypothetical protein